MRNDLKAFLLCVVAVCWSVPAFGQEAVVVVPHYYGLDHATVEYEISGAEKGKEILYFDQWGIRQANYKSAETLKSGFANTINFNFSGDIMFVDPNKTLGQKKQDVIFKKLLADPQAISKGLLSLQSVEISGGKKIGEENILNHACEVWNISALKTKLWLWQGIIMRSEVTTDQGVVKYNAIKIDEVTVIDEAIFTVPPGINFIDRDIMQILISKRVI